MKLTKEQKAQWCREQEAKDWAMFVQTFSGDGKYQFEIIEQLPEYSELDYVASATTKDGQLLEKYTIEYKNRFGYKSTDKCIQDEGSFIEPDKFANLLLEYHCDGRIPLYINKWKDGVYSIWNIKQLIIDKKKRPKYDPRRNVKKSYDGEETVEGRFYLKLEDAINIKP